MKEKIPEFATGIALMDDKDMTPFIGSWSWTSGLGYTIHGWGCEGLDGSVYKRGVMDLVIKKKASKLDWVEEE
jgi:hypothetical protein